MTPAALKHWHIYYCVCSLSLSVLFRIFFFKSSNAEQIIKLEFSQTRDFSIESNTEMINTERLNNCERTNERE